MTVDAAHPMFVALGRELKIARERAGLTQLELASMIHYSDSMVSSVENGKRPPTDEFFSLCDDSLATGGLLVRLLETARTAAQQEMLPAWLREWTEYEREATVLRWYETALVPGLLQTPEYLEVLLRNTSPLADDESIAQEVTTRLERCNILYRDRPPKFFAILDEAVLRRPVGGPKVMRNQLDHLATLNETSRAIIKVIPLSVGFHRGLVGAFILAGFGGSDGEVLYCESHIRGVITESQADVADAKNNWDMISADALPTKLSTQMIKEVAETWT